MKLAIGCDHRGYHAKMQLLPLLKKLGCEVQDFGCHGAQRVDYPDIAYPLAVAVAAGRCDLGIMIDGNGMGMSIVANKVKKVRAATVQDELAARCAREQYHCNVIVIAADLIGAKELQRIVQAFLQTPTAAGRHARRIEKLARIEDQSISAFSRNADWPHTMALSQF